MAVERVDALDGYPSASYTIPSATKPGPSLPNPGSMTASTRRPAQAAGTVPSSRNQLVDHGGPQGVPTENGSNVPSDHAFRASPTGSGSPRRSSTCHTDMPSGTRSA